MLGRRARPAGLKIRKSQQVRSDISEADGVRLDDFREALAVLRVIEASLKQRFGIPANGSERGAKLVRDIGDKILAHPFQALQVSDVVEHRDSAAARGPWKRGQRR